MDAVGAIDDIANDGHERANLLVPHVGGRELDRLHNLCLGGETAHARVHDGKSVKGSDDLLLCILHCRVGCDDNFHVVQGASERGPGVQHCAEPERVGQIGPCDDEELAAHGHVDWHVAQVFVGEETDVSAERVNPHAWRGGGGASLKPERQSLRFAWPVVEVSVHDVVVCNGRLVVGATGCRHVGGEAGASHPGLGAGAESVPEEALSALGLVICLCGRSPRRRWGEPRAPGGVGVGETLRLFVIVIRGRRGQDRYVAHGVQACCGRRRS
mmetsp:Transcript_27725/g.74611  ORF Transcript_27725/g.74611 Transcript_27725/m.74611 type:complete len:271 (-) Transcript_27725:3099-3911(-)